MGRVKNNSDKRETRSDQNKVKRRRRSKRLTRKKKSSILIKPNKLVIKCNSRNNSSLVQSTSSSFTQPSNLSDLPENTKLLPVYPTYARFEYTHPLNCSLEKMQKDLFYLLYTKEIGLTLPNPSWSIHCIERPILCIILSETTLHPDRGSGYIPHYGKQIVFHKNMAYEIILFNSKILHNEFHPVNTVRKVMEVVTYTYNLILCNGGPDVGFHKNIILECAYIYKERWRHNLCTLIVRNVGETCSWCLTLEKKVQQRIERTKELKNKTSTSSGKRKKKI